MLFSTTNGRKAQPACQQRRCNCSAHGDGVPHSARLSAVWSPMSNCTIWKVLPSQSSLAARTARSFCSALPPVVAGLNAKRQHRRGRRCLSVVGIISHILAISPYNPANGPPFGGPNKAPRPQLRLRRPSPHDPRGRPVCISVPIDVPSHLSSGPSDGPPLKFLSHSSISTIVIIVIVISLSQLYFCVGCRLARS